MPTRLRVPGRVSDCEGAEKEPVRALAGVFNMVHRIMWLSWAVSDSLGAAVSVRLSASLGQRLLNLFSSMSVAARDKLGLPLILSQRFELWALVCLHA